jgi:TatD DNase family protein
VPNLYDAHNHLQDERLWPNRAALVQTTRAERVRYMVVNGSNENDWPEVLALAMEFPEVIPSFGYHPWYIKQRSDNWERDLAGYLDRIPSGVGEVGLDRWIKGYDSEDQERVFLGQLQMATERDRPLSVHCLQAWGRLLELLQQNRRPRCGFLLHSFGGPKEMIPSLAGLGAYFSLPGYFAHDRKTRQREAFKSVPRDRLLLETDAPDQPLPAERVKHRLLNARDGKELNHPANIVAVYEFAANLMGESVDNLAAQIEENFERLFGSLKERKT